MKNPYPVLGIDPDATKEEIKEAYRKKAKIHHPDTGGDEEKFKEVQKAYERISTGEVGSTGRSTYRSGRAYENINFDEKTVEEFIEDYRKWADTESPFGTGRNQTVKINFETAVLGEDNLNIGGVTIDVPPGVRDKTKLFFPGVGNSLIFEVENNTNYWRKNKNDIYVKKKIPVWKAMGECELEAETLSGKKVKTKLEPGTRPGSTFRFRGMGGPETFDNIPQGDFYVKIDVDIPTIEDSKVVNEIKELLK